ncbi:MAG: ester cyclase [Gaiella sp.]|nr:ester cyclase [Gaiella sp.]
MNDGHELSLVERWLAAGDACDLDVFDEVLHPEVVVHAPAGLSTHGVDAEKEVWRQGLAAIPGLRHDVQEVVRDGSTLVARVVVTGTFERALGELRPTGLPFRLDQAVIAHVADGRIVEAWEIANLLPLVTGPAVGGDR